MNVRGGVERIAGNKLNPGLQCAPRLMSDLRSVQAIYGLNPVVRKLEAITIFLSR